MYCWALYYPRLILPRLDGVTGTTHSNRAAASYCRAAPSDGDEDEDEDEGSTPRLEAVQLRGVEFRPVFLFPELFWYGYDPRVRVDASCDGMLIMDRKICNPATRQSRSFSRNPKLDFTRIIGLFRHQPSAEYRVLFWRHPDNWPFPEPIEYCVLTVGSCAARQIESSLTPVDDGVDYEFSEMGPWIFDAPVLLHGRLHMHWKQNVADYYHWIIVFDTVAESFRHMRPPAVSPGRGAHLFDMGGTLAACTSKDDMSEISIFVLQDHQHDGVWAFHYQIKLPVMDIRRFQEEGDWCARVVSEEGDVHCDRKGNLVANYPYDDDDHPVVIPHRLRESLVQPTIFHKDNNWF
ncbi:unnamed protein product [Alopecurus aequalis]